MFHLNTLFGLMRFEHVAETNIIQLDFILVIFAMIDFETDIGLGWFQDHRFILEIISLIQIRY